MNTNKVSDDEIEVAFRGTNFGHSNHRELLAASVFKTAVGHHCGHTITMIMKRMELVGRNGKVLARGRAFLAEHYRHLMVISG